jgi:hypothetical protein
MMTNKIDVMIEKTNDKQSPIVEKHQSEANIAFFLCFLCPLLTHRVCVVSTPIKW